MWADGAARIQYAFDEGKGISYGELSVHHFSMQQSLYEKYLYGYDFDRFSAVSRIAILTSVQYNKNCPRDIL